MVSWTRAFKAAGLTVLYRIAWGIAGGLIILAGFFSILSVVRFTYYGIPEIDWGRAIGGIILMVIGILIYSLGSLATLYKVGTEIIVDGVKATGVIQPTPPPPPGDIIFCPSCGSTNRKGTNFCTKCGTQLK